MSAGKPIFDAYACAVEALRKQKYHLIGLHSAVKKCHWVHRALTARQFCYKCKFYGIRSHRCVQMTPAMIWCWHRCLHCWRVEPEDINVDWGEPRIPYLDDPEIIVDLAIKEHQRILSGYKGHPKVTQEMLEEGMEPKHAAISLSGEPTLYPLLSDLIEEFHRRGMTTFLVTRGVRPDVLSTLDEEPSQLYISMEMPVVDDYLRFNRPIVAKGWDLIRKTIELLPSFSCPTVLRITLVKGLNDKYVEEYVKIIEKAEPTYVEVKSYMSVGYSRWRLGGPYMPSHEEVKSYAMKLAEKISYNLVDESKPSRVVLLSRLTKPIRVGDRCYL